MQLVEEEQQRFPGWALFDERDGLIDDYHQRQLEEASIASGIFCSSTFARNALLQQGIAPDKIHIVPLGISPRFGGCPRESDTVGPLHVLFVGSDGLRKGIGYLHQAKKLLATSKIEIRAVGDLELAEMGLRALSDSMELLGPIPRARIQEYYQWADVLVLPSTSDTFGLVVLEAMASGVAVVASQNTCGPDVIRNEVDGFVIPIRDAAAIATCLDRLAGDRHLVRDMGISARMRAAEFTDQRYTERLLAALG
jgi:glycosyltransferase involved in cell wall biosynthesis